MLVSSNYPTNFEFSDESFSHSNQPLFAFDDHWSASQYPNDTLPIQCLGGMDAFGDVTTDGLPGEFSSDGITDDEVVSTPPPSSPLPYCSVFPYATQAELLEPKEEVASQIAQSLHHRQLYLQYQQYQYQLMQQKMMLSSLQLPPISNVPTAVPVSLPPLCRSNPVAPHDTRYYDTLRNDSSDFPQVQLTSLDTSHFGTNISPYPKLKSIPHDISGNLTDAQYHKIFKKYHLHLQLDSHPTMTEQDLEDIKVRGRMYFLKNVKTIVPKVGPWKFNAHISHRRTDERQYNIPGMAITCKVKEWLTDDGLWRLYHYKKGKTVKPRS